MNTSKAYTVPFPAEMAASANGASDTDLPYLSRIEADFYAYTEDYTGDKLLSLAQDLTRDQEEVYFSNVPAPQEYLIRLLYISAIPRRCAILRFSKPS